MRIYFIVFFIVFGIFASENFARTAPADNYFADASSGWLMRSESLSPYSTNQFSYAFRVPQLACFPAHELFTDSQPSPPDGCVSLPNSLQQPNSSSVFDISKFDFKQTLGMLGIDFDFSETFYPFSVDVVKSCGGGRELQVVLPSGQQFSYFCKIQPSFTLADCAAKIGGQYRLSSVTEAAFGISYVGSNPAFVNSGLSFSKGSIPIDFGITINL